MNEPSNLKKDREREKIHLSEFFPSLGSTRIEDKSLSLKSPASEKERERDNNDFNFLGEIFIVDLNVGVKNIVSLCGLISLTHFTHLQNRVLIALFNQI